MGDDAEVENEDGQLSDQAMAEMTISECGAALADKENERVRLQADIDAFLSRGGAIKTIASNVLADPPKKPESNYGGQPI